jgi:hypothetical protein
MLLRWTGTSLALAEPSFSVIENKAALKVLEAALDKRVRTLSKAA